MRTDRSQWLLISFPFFPLHFIAGFQFGDWTSDCGAGRQGELERQKCSNSLMLNHWKTCQLMRLRRSRSAESFFMKVCHGHKTYPKLIQTWGKLLGQQTWQAVARYRARLAVLEHLGPRFTPLVAQPGLEFATWKMREEFVCFFFGGAVCRCL